METRHKQIVRIVLAAAVVAASLIAWLLSTPAPGMSVSGTPLEFDAARALGAAHAFVTRNPDRLFGSLESRQSSGDLIDSLSSLGYEVEFLHFDARVRSRNRVGRNVLALKKGESDEIVAIVAHYDTADTAVEGGMKTAPPSGCSWNSPACFRKPRPAGASFSPLPTGGNGGTPAPRTWQPGIR